MPVVVSEDGDSMSGVWMYVLFQYEKIREGRATHFIPIVRLSA